MSDDLEAAKAAAQRAAVFQAEADAAGYGRPEVAPMSAATLRAISAAARETADDIRLSTQQVEHDQQLDPKTDPQWRLTKAMILGRARDWDVFAKRIELRL